MPLINALLLDPAPFEAWIAARSDGQTGCGTLNDPYNGSTKEAFDGVMKSLANKPSTALVHLGPGIFETEGYKDASPSAGWQIQPGMRIVGSGVGVTTIKLMAVGSGRFYAIGHDLGFAGARDLCEVSGLTIDCNLPESGALACGAIRLMGNHVRIRNVRAVNWGAHASGPTCYVFAAISGDRSDGSSVPFEPIDVGIEGCIAEELSIHNTGRTNVFHVGGSNDVASVPEAFGKVPFIRNCFVDGTVPGDSPPNPLAAHIRALSMNWCKGGVLEGNQIQNVQIGGPYIENATCRDVIVRENAYKNVKRGPYLKIGPQDAPGSEDLFSLERDTSNPLYTTALATTTAALVDHGLSFGDRVRITASGGPNKYRGVFVITGQPATNTFTYLMEGDPGGDAPVDPMWEKVFGLSNLIIEKNVIELATGTNGQIAIHIDDGQADNITTPDAPDYDCLNVIIRENRIRYSDGKVGAGYSGSGIKVSGVKEVIVQENVLEVDPTNPIQDFRCGKVRYLDNRNLPLPDLNGLVPDTDKFHPELEVPSEEAFAFANLDK